MSQRFNDKEKKVLTKASVYQNKSTSLESDHDWSDFSEASDAEKDQFESLDDIFGSPTTNFGPEQDCNFNCEDNESDTDEFSSDEDWDEKLIRKNQFFDKHFGNPCTLSGNVTETPVIEKVVNSFNSLHVTKHCISGNKTSKSILNETYFENYHEVKVATKVCLSIKIFFFQFHT